VWGYPFGPTTPFDVVGMGSGVVSIAAGQDHSCAALTSGDVKCWGSNSFGQLGVAFSVARQVISLVPAGDADADGCQDKQELGASALLGGRRDPLSVWDFMDQFVGLPPARDGVVAGGDIGAVVARYGSMGDPGGDPLVAPLSMTGYHTSADRSGAMAGGDPWDLAPPDGSISGGDIGAAVAQFGHSCM
jgi:hypothetical protein